MLLFGAWAGSRAAMDFSEEFFCPRWELNPSDNSKTTGISTALGTIPHRQSVTDTLSQNGNLIAVTSYRIFFQCWFYIETLGQWPAAIVPALPLREY